MTGKFYKIKIGDIWLTHNGLESGRACKTTIPNAAELTGTIAGAMVQTIGRRVVQKALGAGNIDFEIQVQKMSAATWNALKELRESLLASGDDVNITGETDSGNPGDFDVNTKPRPDEMFTYERFNSGYVFGVSLKFYTV